MRKPLIQFTVRCHPRYRFTFKVTVLRSQRDLDAYRNRNCAVRSKCVAYCNGYKLIRFKGGKQETSNEIGDIVFSWKALRMGIICHEAVHAGVQFMRAARKPMDFDVPVNRTRCNKNEELFAWVVGNVARDIVLKAVGAVKEKKA